MDNILFARHYFPPDIIRHAIWLCAQFTLSYRNAEDLLTERDLDISYEIVRPCLLKFGALIARNLRSVRPAPRDYCGISIKSSSSSSFRDGITSFGEPSTIKARSSIFLSNPPQTIMFTPSVIYLTDPHSSGRRPPHSASTKASVAA
jgi:hypothetical protein